ncbi:hypothetical protein PIB30_017213 [Stylosanthes scabra]|uniref:Uncharacterized protein n=1 Tax=Stylosanthes scabra TaxID=79078 RepID=A0ABU6Y6B9_9FABA|nr:hypothetical protein [Stylosanthes scabra]
MGLPTIAWSEKTFRNIAELWDKYVYTDDRTEEIQSFSAARFEFGAEVYSRESHLNAAELAYMGEAESKGGSKSLSLVEETPMAVPTPLAAIGDSEDGGLNDVAVNNIDDFEISGGGVNEGNHDGGVVSPVVDLGLADLPDPTSKTVGRARAGLPVNTGLQCPSPSPSKTGSCPFPPEFEPDTSSAHLHGLITSSPHLHGPGSDRIDPIEMLEEAIRTKHLCEVGGFSFKNGESKELLTSIARIELGKKARLNACSQSKKKKVVSKTTSGDSSRSSDGDMILASFLGKKNPKKLKAGSNGKSSK